MWNYDGRFDDELERIEALQASLCSEGHGAAPCGPEPLVEVLGGVHARLITGNALREEGEAAIALAEQWLGI